VLDKIVDEQKEGYVFLLGGPGTGKSTLLTEWSKNRKERIIRYYAFDFTAPSTRNNNAERGETMTFYYDLVSQLKDQGIYKEQSLLAKDINFLRKAFERQLQELTAEYKNTGRKTILIIDGLDHVPRYSGVQKSLLADLLLPAEIPEGVYIILGSQSFEIEAIPLEIQQAWKAKDRSVTMARLSKQDVENYISKIAKTPLDAEQKEILYTISQGHPLYLSYVVNKINQDGSFLGDQEFLPIDGDINLYYEKFWAALEKAPKLRHMLGLCARITGPIALSFIAEWNLDDETQLAFKDKALFLFNNVGNSLSFFHNSFRHFLLAKTATSILTDEFDKNKDKALHEELAGYYQKSQTQPVWNAAHHLFQAGKTEEFMQMANPDAFAEQLSDFRSEQEIDTDIKTGLLIGRDNNDAHITLRYLLSLNELESRGRHTGVSSYIEEFIQLGNIEQAKKLIRDDTQLLVSKSYALDCCRLLFDADEKQEAKLIYSLATPEEISKSGIIISRRSHEFYQTVKVLENWAGTAALFEKAATVAGIISNISLKAGDTLDPKDLTYTTNPLFLAAADIYAAQEQWEEYDILMDAWQKNANCDTGYYSNAVVNAARYCLNNGDSARGADLISILKSKKDEWAYSDYKKLSIAALLYNAKAEIAEVKEWIHDVPQPELRKSAYSTPDLTFNDYTERILLNTLLTLTGEEPNILEVVKDAPGANDQLRVEFERMLVLMAKLHANGIKNTGPQEIWHNTIPIVRFYYTMPSKHDTTWYSLDRMKKEYFNFLLQAVSRWGEDVFKNFMDNLIQEIKSHQSSWRPGIVREILVQAFYHGYPREVVVAELEALETDMLEGHDTSGRVDECSLHAKAWIALEEKERAIKWISQSLKEAFSVGYRKDYQFNRWLEWLIKVNKVQPDKAAKRLALFLRFLPHLKQTVEGSPFYSGAKQVLKIGFSIDFGVGVQQFIWQLENGIIALEDGISVMLSSMISQANSEAETANVSLIYEKLLLYIAEDDSTETLQALLEKQFHLLRPSAFKDQVRKLINSINIYCQENKRGEAIGTIQKFLHEKGITVEGLPAIEPVSPKAYESGNELVLLPDHQHLSETVVLSKIDSFEDFKTLFETEDKANSFFSWKKVVEKISPALTLENIKDLCKSGVKGKRHSELMSLLSMRALELGDPTLAGQLADLSLDQSSSSGWSSFYDGGTKLHAMRAFQKIDDVKGKKLAMDALTEDIIQTKDPDSLLASWEEILPLISTGTDPVRMWEEIESYLNRLFGNADLAPVPEFKPLEQKEALVMLLIYFSKMQVKVVSSTSKKLLADMACKDRDTFDLFYKHCRQSPGSSVLYSEIVLLMSTEGNEILMPHIDSIKELAVDENYQVRSNAIEILSKLGKDGEIPVPVSRELDISFILHLPADEKFREIKSIKPSENVQDTVDPLKVISSHLSWLGFLVSKAGIPKENILRRWVALTNEKAGASHTSQHYEKELSEHLKKLSLDFPFQRPRVAAVETGLNYLLTELIDSGNLDPSDVTDYLAIDPSLEQKVLIQQRPVFVARLNEKSHGFVGEEWVDKIDEHNRLKEGLLNYGDSVIIAENSYTKEIVWGIPSETFTYYCKLDSNSTKGEEYDSNIIRDCKYTEYHSLKTPSDAFLTVSNQSDYSFHLGYLSNWVAFNPAIARKLGWVPSSKANFAWENQQRELMSHSVFWRSGNIYTAPPGKDSESGEGWYVLVTKKGLEEFKKGWSKVTIVKEIQRDWQYGHSRSRQKTIEIALTI
jgi:NACHT domain